MSDEKIKDIFDSFCELLENLSDFIDLEAPSPSGYGKMTLLELFYEDMRDFLLYLSCADGVITKAEAEFLDDYLEYFMTPEQMRTRILQEDIFSTDFEESPQMSLRIMVDMQNQYEERGTKLELFYPLREIYRLLGIKFIGRANAMSNAKMIALGRYLEMINDYAKENLVSFEKHEKENLVKRINELGGIQAPKKIM